MCQRCHHVSLPTGAVERSVNITNIESCRLYHITLSYHFRTMPEKLIRFVPDASQLLNAHIEIQYTRKMSIGFHIN